MSQRTDLSRFPLLGSLTPGTAQHHEVALPGEALSEEHWPVTTVAGSEPGPAIFINAGIHGGEYPAIETVIRLGKLLRPKELAGVVVLMPVVNLPAFWERSMFVCPIDNVNPNRVFPGDPEGTYTEQLIHSLTSEFIAHADVYIDLHGGDIVEALEPFAICQRGDQEANRKAAELAEVFGLPNLLIIDRPVQQTEGTLSFVAATELGVPAFIAEAGGVGQLEEEAVTLLTNGVLRVLTHLGMFEEQVPDAAPPAKFKKFEWLYSEQAGLFYPTVSAGDQVETGQTVGSVGSLFGATVEEVTSPVAGRVLFLTTSPAVKEGGLLMGIGVT